MRKVFLIAIISLLSNRHYASAAALNDDDVTPASVTPDEGLTTEEAVTTVPADQEKCVRDMECTRCLELEECKFITFKVDGAATSTQCIAIEDDVPAEPEAGDPYIALNVTDCQSGGQPDVSTVTPTPTTPMTTTSTESTTDIPTSTTTTTTTTVTTAAPSPTTTTTTTTIAPTAPTAAPVPPPEPKEGHFDGWSFFGGILLTLGLAAIGFVGVKYYKLRSGAGGNYNRF